MSWQAKYGYGLMISDREAWMSARTLADLGELTALWLEGRILHQPGRAEYAANIRAVTESPCSDSGPSDD